MHRNIFRAAVILVLTVGSQLASSETFQGAHIEIEREFDFKTVEQGTVAEHTFVVRNSGTDTLHIVSVHASCGCTGTIMSDRDKHIAPGATGSLRVTYDANNKAEGPFAKRVTILSNSRIDPEAIVAIRGAVVKSSRLAHD